MALDLGDPAFAVIATRDGLYGHGKLIVGEAAGIILEVDRLSKILAIGERQFIHRLNQVSIVHLRLLPPFVSCAVPIQDENEEVLAVARFPVWTRANVRLCAADAGFVPVDVGRWMSLPSLGSASG